MFQPNYPKAALGLEKEFITALALQKEGRRQFGIKQAATIVAAFAWNAATMKEKLARKPLPEERSRR